MKMKKKNQIQELECRMFDVNLTCLPFIFYINKFQTNVNELLKKSS